MAADHCLVIVTGDDRVDEPELADRAGECFQLSVRDAARVGRVGVQVGDCYVGYLEVSVRVQEKSPLHLGATVGTKSALGGGHEGHESRIAV